MAICEDCEQEMTTGESCTTTELHRLGEAVPLLPYGKEPRWPARERPCGDCATPPGGFHHLGCDLQRCPGCGGQLISCGCRWDEFADEYDDDEYDDDEPDERAVVSLFAEPMRVGPPRETVPVGAAAAPLRARHHARVRAVAEWAVGVGRPCDLDVVAICLEAIERRRGSGVLELHRPGVRGILWADVHNTKSLLDTTLPDDWHVHLWTILCAAAENGWLSPDSDPLPALLEPLRCYGGLGADGFPMAEGEDVDFPCQCYVPFDPSLPEGLSRFLVGHDPDTHAARFAEARLLARRDDPHLSDFEPLFALAQRLRSGPSGWAIHTDEYTFMGVTVPGPGGPELWIYQCVRDEGGLCEPVTLDADGQVWTTRPDRRRKVGYRWVPAGDRHAAVRGGGHFTFERRPQAFDPYLVASE